MNRASTGLANGLIALTVVLTLGLDCLAKGFDVRAEFKKHVPRYGIRKKSLQKILDELKVDLFSREEAGAHLPCSQQILTEAQWFLSYTTDFAKAKKRIEDLRKSLADSNDQGFALEQDQTDGTWGKCFTVAFFKLDKTIDHVRALAQKGKEPRFPLKVLDQFNSPERLLAYLESILISDIDVERIDRRKELNYAVGALMRFILDGAPKNYPFHPGLRATLLRFLDERWQDPLTGYWGAWYRSGGSIVKTTDLSITFHIAGFRSGKVSRLREIFDTTLSIRNDSYPFGWLEDDENSTHHLYDAAKLLRYGWERADREKRKVARVEIERALSWTLTNALREDGSFVRGPADDNVADSFYFGVSFLNEIGYFRKPWRFWRSEPFPESRQVCEKIKGKIESLHSPDLMLKDALGKLSECRCIGPGIWAEYICPSFY